MNKAIILIIKKRTQHEHTIALVTLCNRAYRLYKGKLYNLAVVKADFHVSTTMDAAEIEHRFVEVNVVKLNETLKMKIHKRNPGHVSNITVVQLHCLQDSILSPLLRLS